MSYYITLVSTPSVDIDTLLFDFCHFLRKESIELGLMTCLSENEAWDIHIPKGDESLLYQMTESFWSNHAVDYFVAPSEGRRKKLLIADMDSTILRGESLDEISRIAGIAFDTIVSITHLAMQGKMDFHDALRQRVALLKDLPISIIEEACIKTEYMPGSNYLIATMHAHGAIAALVSGGFDFFTQSVGKALGFHYEDSNQFDIQDGKLTGLVIEPISTDKIKQFWLEKLKHHHGLSDHDVMAVGDGANDILMLKAAGLGVGYKAKPLVVAQVKHQIRHTDLTALLYAQGYRKKEFVASKPQGYESPKNLKLWNQIA
jgi:phosphoserine phosphatase